MPAPKRPVKAVLEINKRFVVDEDRWHLLSTIPDLEWQAVVETVLQHIEDATQYSVDPEISREPGLCAHYAGQVGALRYLLACLIDFREKGGKTV
jgi:hypothetical protein